MIEHLVSQCFQRRAIIALVFLFIAAYGCYCWTQLPLEAYPDIAPTTSQVITQVTGLAAEEVEQQITIPLERALMGTPYMRMMRSSSTFGLSLIQIIFQDGTESYWSRERLFERIGAVTLPYAAIPGLDPLTSPIGEIYRYTIESSTYSLRELSELQFWKIIPRLKVVPGVIDVVNFGGLTTQFSLVLDPLKLQQYNLSFQQISQAIAVNNANSGGGYLYRGEQGIVIRGEGLIHNLQELGNIVITQFNGLPIYVKDLGKVQLGHKQREGILGKDKNNDTIEGIVCMLKNENPSQVGGGIHQAVEELNRSILPEGVKIVPYLDRSDLVHATVQTVSHTLFHGMILVTIVLLLFLGNIRAALLVAITIPLSLLIAFICMYQFNIPANLLSLGAIDFGIIVDGSIVVMENILRRREADETAPLSADAVLRASLQVTQPIFFGILVIITAYSVLFAFQQIEYKLFAPMAFAVGFSLIGALLVALLLVPGLSYWAFHNPRHLHKNKVVQHIIERYGQLLQSVVGKTRLVLTLYGSTLLMVILLMLYIGRDFLPYLDEGSIWLQVSLPPGIALAKSSQMADNLRAITLQHPEVKHIVTQLGRNDDGTDAFTPSHIESGVTLQPYNTWPAGKTKQDLIAQLAAEYAKVPGMHVAFTQPIIDNVLDVVAGAHSDLVVKVFGNDLQEVRRLITKIRDIIKATPGAKDVIIAQEPPMTELKIDVHREDIARFGININDVMNVIQTGLGGSGVTRIYIEDRSYDVTVKFANHSRESPETIGNLFVTSTTGAQIPLAQVANIHFIKGETTINRELGHRYQAVRFNIRGRDLGSFYAEASKHLEKELIYDHNQLQVVWGGQLENQQRMQARLALIIPGLLGLMFVLLFSQFGNLRHPSLILMTVPLAMLGGLIALLCRDMTLNVSSAVGFIALFGVAVLNAIIMVANLNRWQRDHHKDLKEAVILGAKERLRPVMMTASVAAIGMLPAALAHGLGSDVQRPLATVIVGGLITATCLTLVLLPALYYVIEKHLLDVNGQKAKEQERED